MWAPAEPDLAKMVIAEFNRMQTWEELAATCGGLQGGRFCAVWRGERTASVALDQQESGEEVCDHGRREGFPKTLDTYAVWCLANHIDKKRDVVERLAVYRKEQKS